MKQGKVLLSSRETELFDRAVRENAIAVVSVLADDGWHSFKCRFLERDPNLQFFVLDYDPVHGGDLPNLSLGQYAGVSFRQSSRKVLLSTVVEAKGRFVTPENREIAAIRYRWPQAITELQRRAFYRTPIPDGMKLVARIWSGGIARRAAAKGTALQFHDGELVDLSCGGCLVRLTGPAPSWKENENVGIELTLADGREPIGVDAQVRGLRTDAAGHTCAAVRFIGMEMSVDGRVVLQRLSQAVQRLHRLNMPMLVMRPSRN